MKNPSKLVGHILDFHLGGHRKKQCGFHTGLVIEVIMFKDNVRIRHIVVNLMNPMTRKYDGRTIKLDSNEWEPNWCGVEVDKKCIPVKDWLNEEV